MTYAIIETGGKQLRVEPGRFYDVERLAVDEDGAVTLDRVLFIDNEGEAHVGQPLVEGATVEATVLRHLRGRKIIVYKMRPKKKTRKKQGHRQELTRVMIQSISVGGQALASSQASTPASSDPSATEAAETTAESADE
jgi:large subunit ribosomal protein L21